MSKKWNTKGSSALSSALAVTILITAGAAVAQQGGLSQVAAGAHDAMQNSDQSARAGDGASGARDAGPGSATGAGAGPSSAGGPSAGGTTGSSGSACVAVVAAVRADMPAASDPHGIREAIARLQTNCATNPQARGLVNALQSLGQGHGSGTTSHPPGSGTTSHPTGHPTSHPTGHPSGSGTTSHGGHPKP